MTTFIEYYKPSGKFYDRTTFEFGPSIKYLYQVTDAVRALAAQGKLPGLESGRWDGYIVIEFNELPAIVDLTK